MTATRHAWCRLVALAALPAWTAAVSAACGDALGAGKLVAASAAYEVAFRPDPAPIAVSRHFALDIAVCPKAGANPPTSLAVDAHMPAHRHGMNYRPTVAMLAPGRYRAEGLLFHMPGEWEFRFDLSAAGASERAAIRTHVP